MSRAELIKYILTVLFIIISIILMGMTIYKSNKETRAKYKYIRSERIVKN